MMKLNTLAVGITVISFNSLAMGNIVYDDFSSINGVALCGSAVQSSDVVRLTASQAFQTGGFWSTSKQSVQEGFNTTFQFQITNPRSYPNSGADGFALIMQNDSATALGTGGGGMGYTGLNDRIAIEFDTYNNSTGYPGENLDPSDNHVSVQIKGIVPNESDHANSLGCTSAIPRMIDENIHAVNIRYQPGLMAITFDNADFPNLQVNLFLENYMTLSDGKAWVGFTAATGTGWETHDILSWSFMEVPEPATLFLLVLGGLGLMRRRNA